MSLGPSGNRRLHAVRACIALASSNVRYWRTVAPVVRKELARWTQQAQTIEDPDLRALALAKLHEEGFNAEAGAMLATVAPRRHRGDAVKAIVALELLFDYLDGLTERPSAEPLAEGKRLFSAYTDAFSENGERASGRGEELLEDGGYLQALSQTAGEAFARLPAVRAVSAVACRSAERSAQAQIRMHMSSTLGTTQLEQWARAEAESTGLQWRELLAAAASSVLAVHALIAAAADPLCTHEQAASIEDAYLSLCVVLTLLDGVVDHDRDSHSRGGLTPMRLGYADLFENDDLLGEVLSSATKRAALRVGALRDGPHHTAILAGVIAYYSSHPGARSAYAAPLVARVRKEIGSLVVPPLMLMRAWRLAKRLRNRRRDASA